MYFSLEFRRRFFRNFLWDFVFKKIRHIHFVGIGGSGMSGIAEVLLKLGYEISGSDLHKNREAQRLQELGAKVFEGHAPENIDGAHVVVTSTAVSPKNPEVVAAQKAGVPVIPRIEMLAEIARLKYTIAIAGTHGKTTTTSLVGQVLKNCGLDPTVVVGGRLRAVGTGGVLGKGDFLVAEADESDGSFLKLSPTIGVVTNIDDDHLNYYLTMKNLENAFAEFSNRIPFYGVTILCGDDPGVRRILPRISRRYLTYGFGKNWDYRAENLELKNGGSEFDVIFKGNRLGRVALNFPGRHNVLNSLAALAVGLELDLPFNQIVSGLAQFSGVGRRLEMKGEAKGVTVLDDYGHHPTEMAATIQAVRERWPRERLIVIFQPHRFTRTQQLYLKFARVLSLAEKVYLMPIYPAGEKPLKGVSSILIAKNIKKKNWEMWDENSSLSNLIEELKPGDILLTLGAGDVWKIGEEFLRTTSSLAHRIAEAVPSLKGRILIEEPLSRHCTWAIGGPAEAYVEVQNLDELKGVLKYCRDQNIPKLIVGWGSNVLFPDEGLRGCVVRLKGEFESVEFSDTKNYVKVGAGVHVPKLVRKCAARGLAGVEPLIGVPGTVGGAVIMNAGTPRGVLGDVLVAVEILNEDGSVSTIERNQMKLGYRTSGLEGKLVVSATLGLNPAPPMEIEQRIKKELARREKTQPLGTKNAGSVFRNPENNFAGKLIEEAGLKGKEFGRVMISGKHANFIENLGGASAKEVVELMALAQKMVKEKFNVDLIPEVKVLVPNGKTTQ